MFFAVVRVSPVMDFDGPSKAVVEVCCLYGRVGDTAGDSSGEGLFIDSGRTNENMFCYFAYAVSSLFESARIKTWRLVCLRCWRLVVRGFKWVRLLV